MPERRRFLILTPGLDGADGISELSRQTIRAIAAKIGPENVDVWSLAGEPDRSVACRHRTARGSRLTMIGWTIGRAALPIGNLTVIVLHAHLAPLAGLLGLRGARVTVFLVGIEVWRRLRVLERFAVRRADPLVAISRETERRFRAANPDVVNPVAVCPPGIGPAASARHREGETGFALIVGRVWAEERYKGHDSLIEIWSDVRNRVPSARLVVVGSGNDLPRLEARAQAAGLASAIRFTGRVPDEELIALYEAAAFFVMPSANEGFGLVYLEAMRAGKPCIALHGAADDIVEDGVSGILVDGGDTERLTDAVVHLFLDTDARHRMGRAAAARVAREFTEEHYARRLRYVLGMMGGDAHPVAVSTLPVIARGPR